MSRTVVHQTWRNREMHRRTWTINLYVTVDDLTADETAALEPVIAAIETYTATLDGRADKYKRARGSIRIDRPAEDLVREARGDD